jgi:hypothetical protein
MVQIISSCFTGIIKKAMKSFDLLMVPKVKFGPCLYMMVLGHDAGTSEVEEGRAEIIFSNRGYLEV